MSPENVEIVRQVVDAFRRGDFDTALQAFDAEVVYEVLPSTGPEPGVHRGHDGLREAFARWMSAWEEYETGLEELIDAGDYVIVVGWDRGRAGGLPVERRDVAFVYQLDGGRIVHAWMYGSKAEALEALGLRE